MLSCYNTVILMNVLQEPKNKPPSFLLNAQLSSSVQKVISSPAKRTLWTLGVFTLGTNIWVSTQESFWAHLGSGHISAGLLSLLCMRVCKTLSCFLNYFSLVPIQKLQRTSLFGCSADHHTGMLQMRCSSCKRRFLTMQPCIFHDTLSASTRTTKSYLQSYINK